MFVPLRDINATRVVPFVSYALLAANVAAFVSMTLLFSAAGPEPAADALVFELGLVPARISTQPWSAWYTVFTSMFMHGGVAHLFSNMLFLHVFADNVEDALGHARFTAFYLLCGVCAAAAQVMVDPNSPVPMVGASGAIAGVVGAYLVLYPRAPIVTFNSVFLLWFVMGLFPIVPAWVIAGEFFLVNLLQGLGSLGVQLQGGVAFFAHLGGFVAGIVLVRLWAVGRRDVRRWQGFRDAATSRRRRRRF